MFMIVFKFVFVWKWTTVFYVNETSIEIHTNHTDD